MSELKWPQEEKLSNQAELQSVWDLCISLQQFFNAAMFWEIVFGGVINPFRRNMHSMAAWLDNEE